MTIFAIEILNSTKFIAILRAITDLYFPVVNHFVTFVFSHLHTGAYAYVQKLIITVSVSFHEQRGAHRCHYSRPFFLCPFFSLTMFLYWKQSTKIMKNIMQVCSVKCA